MKSKGRRKYLLRRKQRESIREREGGGIPREREMSEVKERKKNEKE